MGDFLTAPENSALLQQEENQCRVTPPGRSMMSGLFDLQSAVGNTAMRNLMNPPEITPPVPGVNQIGFIDNSDGANIRTGPAEAGGQALTSAPLPPATRVFVSGTHPDTAEWWYVSAFLEGVVVRGYLQALRVNTDLPEPTAKLYQIKPGDTAEKLAVQEFSSAVRDGHDLRYYENVLLFVNRDKGRAGVRGTYQDPGLFGGGANNVQLEAGRRIWLVSPAYARAVEGVVPDGSLTNGVYAKVKRFAQHIKDIIESAVQSPRFFGEIAGEYAQAIRDHAAEIIGIVTAFVAAEALSMFLAATPTGVGQAAAVVIQLLLAAFGAAGMVEAALQAAKHAERWLTLAWRASGDADQLDDASREFVRMLVSIALAALSYVGVKGNYGKALSMANSVPAAPAFALAGGGVQAGAGTGAPALALPGPAGPFGMAMSQLNGPGGAVASSPKEVARKAAELEQRIEAIADEKLMNRLEKIDLDSPDAFDKLNKIERDLSIAEEGPQLGDLHELDDLSNVKSPGGAQPKHFASGNFAHKYLEHLKTELQAVAPPKFADDVAKRRIVGIEDMPDGLRPEVKLGDTARVDRLGSNIVYEIKPNTVGSIEQGLEQVAEYVKLANAMKLNGRTDWTGIVVIYDAVKAQKFVP
jgi:hypothetical protein